LRDVGEVRHRVSQQLAALQAPGVEVRLELLAIPEQTAAAKFQEDFAAAVREPLRNLRPPADAIHRLVEERALDLGEVEQ